MSNGQTEETLQNMRNPLDSWYCAETPCVDNYMRNVEDYIANGDAELCILVEGRKGGYYRAVKIRDAAVAQG